MTKAADGYTFASDTAGEYDVSYYAIDSSDNEVEEFISVTVNPVKTETELEQGQNNLSNLAQSEVTFVENFEKGYESPLAKGFDFSQATGKPNASIVANENSIAGNSLIIDYTTCAYNTNTQFWFGSLDNYLRSGKWTISMDVTVLGGTAPSGLYFSFIYDGDQSGDNQEIALGEVGETKTLNFEGIKNLDDTKTWHFRVFFFTGSSTYKYDDFRIAIDNIRITVKEVVDAVVERTGTPKELAATDLDGNGYTLTGADNNYTALTNMKYLDKSKLVAGDYLTAEQAANLTTENGFTSDYVILANTQLIFFDSLNGLCSDKDYEYTVTFKVYSPNNCAWVFTTQSGSGANAHTSTHSVNNNTATWTVKFNGAESIYRVGWYYGQNCQLFIGDITVSRALRTPVDVSANGYKVGQKWTKSLSEMNFGNKGTPVQNTETVGGGTLSDYAGFENGGLKFTAPVGDDTYELFRDQGKTLEAGCSYKITFNLYVTKATGRFIFRFDSDFQLFDSDIAGYKTVTLNYTTGGAGVDFFSFYVPDDKTAEFYCSSITYELTALA